jgi:glycosyltransferase involved in cell wall biosynthesis
MRIAYFSPLPPQRSGIADYSAELLPYLARQAEIELFIDSGYQPIPEIAQAFPIHDYRKFPRLAQKQDYDVCLYQMGNHAGFHEYIYRMLLEHPGIVVLHEYVLQHFIQGITLLRGDQQGYVEEMRYCYGQTGAYLAQQMIAVNWSVDTWAYPLFERVVDASLGLIVHNEYTRQRVLESRPMARISKVSHHLCLDALPTDTSDALRGALGLSPEAFVVGSFGFVASPKRLEVSLRAFARFRREFPDAIYVIVGQVLPSADIERLIEAAGLGDKVILTGYVDLKKLLQYMAVVDLAINLRFPTGGETSGSAIRLMGMGKPVIMSNAGSFAEYPDDCCIKIDVDEQEEEMLLVMMRALTADENLRQQIGANAQRYIQTHHTLEGSARGYIDFIQDILTSPPRPFATVPPLTKPAKDDVLTELIADVAAEMVDLGIGETDEGILRDVAQSIVDLGANKSMYND